MEWVQSKQELLQVALMLGYNVPADPMTLEIRMEKKDALSRSQQASVKEETYTC